MRPQVTIHINGKNVTADITPYIIDFRYTDNESGKSDDLEFQVTDHDGLFRGEWQPSRGDKITAWLGTAGAPKLPCGTFVIDEITAQGVPDTVTVRAIATAHTKAVRTLKSAGYEAQTLADVVNRVAASAGYTVEGNIAPVPVTRITQNKETDLQFLARLAAAYGHAFSVRDTRVTFTDVFELEKSSPTTSVDRVDMMRYSFTERTADTYKSAETSYTSTEFEDIQDGAAVTDIDIEGAENTADALVIYDREENRTAAKRKARAALHQANKKQRTASFTVPGNTNLCAGVNIGITGLGNYSGRYHVTATMHTVNGAGWTVDVEAYRLDDEPAKAKRKPSRVRKRAKTKAQPGPIAYYRMGYSGSKEIGAGEIPKFQNTKPK